jgi:hypothetical protein
MTNGVTKSAVVLARVLTLALGFATIQPAFAHNAHSHRINQTSMPAHAATRTWHRHHARGHRSATPGYAGPMPAVVPAEAATYAGSETYFVPGRGIVGESCDLPTSSCPNDMRTAN